MKSSVIGLVAASLLGASALSGCAAVEVSPPLKPCSPSYVVDSNFGNFSIQQRGRSQALQWGAYPNATYSGTRYVIDVYTGSRRYDHKDQNYAPHGSVDASTASRYSGQVMNVTGEVSRGGDVVLEFSMRCTIA